MSLPFAFDPTMEPTGVVDIGTTRDGLSQLRRRWLATDAWAVVLLVHGIAEHSGRYEHVARQLVDAGISVVAFDLRGFGDSGGPRGHVDDFARFHDGVEDHLDEIAALGVPTVLLGHSMGGLVAASYGLTERPQPDRVVLSAPAMALATPRPLWRAARTVGEMVPRLRFTIPIDPEDLSTDPRVGRAYTADPLVDLRVSTGLIAEMVDTILSIEGELDRWRHPTLVLHGDADEIVPPVASEPLGELGPVERRIYPGMRHEVFNEPGGPTVVAELVHWLRHSLDRA